MIDFLQWPGQLSPVPELRTPLVSALDLCAVAVCAVTGVLVARGKKMDLMGVSVIAVVSALGGGTIRDLLLGCSPVFWVAQPLGVAVAMAGGWLTFLLSRRINLTPSAFAIPDALGLALFTVVGAEKSLCLGHGWLVSALMGVITGVFGGVLRDIICREIPSVFQRTELYATASLAGALGLVIARGLGVLPLQSVLLGLAIVAAMRLAACRWKLTLPVAE